MVDVANDTDSAPLNGKGGSPRENGNGLESNGNSSNSLSEKGIKKEPGMFDGSFLNINLNINSNLFNFQTIQLIQLLIHPLKIQTKRNQTHLYSTTNRPHRPARATRRLARCQSRCPLHPVRSRAHLHSVHHTRTHCTPLRLDHMARYRTSVLRPQQTPTRRAWACTTPCHRR